MVHEFACFSSGASARWVEPAYRCVIKFASVTKFAVICFPQPAWFVIWFARGAFASPRGFLWVSFGRRLRIFFSFALSSAFRGRTGGPLWTFHRRSVPVVALVASGTFPVFYPLSAIIRFLVLRVRHGLGS